MRALACCLSLGMIACASQPAPKAKVGPSAADYAPLAVGASRTYAVQYPGQTGERTITVLKKDGGYFIDDAQGAFRITPEGLRDRERFLIRAPLQEGNTWKAILSASAVEHYRIISVGQPCRSRAGGFSDCLVVEATIRQDKSMTLRIRWSWAKDVGLAKIETFAELPGKKRIPPTTQSLIHYQLKPGAKPAPSSVPKSASKTGPKSKTSPKSKTGPTSKTSPTQPKKTEGPGPWER